MSRRFIPLLLSATFALSAVMPQAPAVQQTQSTDVVQVRDHHRRFYRHHDRRFSRHHGNPYYNGHRGFRHHRHGYRRYNGYWFPPAAFALGAIIGSQPRYYHVRPAGNAHVRWCYNHYRSYRAWDNTFQPYHGPRRACRSPYGY